MIKRIYRDKCCLIMICCWLILLWVCTFVGDANGSTMYIYTALLGGALCVAFTIGWSRVLIWNDNLSFFYKEDGDRSVINTGEDNYMHGLRISLLIVLLLSIVYYIGIVAGNWANWISFFDGTIIPKYILNVLMFVVFPVWTTYIMRQVKNGYTIESLLSGCVQIIALSFLGYLLFMKGPYIWLVYIATLNIATILLGIRKYLWEKINRKAVAIFFLIYVIIWIIFLSISWDKSWSFLYLSGFNSSLDFNRYQSVIKKILYNACSWGQSSKLLNDPYVLQLLYLSHLIIPSVLTYLGWVPGILLIVVEGVFLISAGEVVKRSKSLDGRDIILEIVWIGLFIRVIGGLLSSFGIPVPVSLPFVNFGRIIADSICVGILIMAFLKNKYEEYPEQKIEI